MFAFLNKLAFCLLIFTLSQVTYAQSKKEQIEDLNRQNDSLRLLISDHIKKSEVDANICSEKSNQLNKTITELEKINHKLRHKIDSINSNKLQLADIYLNADYYLTDTIYRNVLISGKKYNVHIISDKYDNHFELVQFDETDDFMNNRPRTIVFIEINTNKAVFIEKIDIPITSIVLYKPGKQLEEEGDLFLSYISSGGGSGYSGELYHLNLLNDKIELFPVIEFGELDFVLHHKIHNHIIVLSGIWANETDENGDPIEAHFSEHRYSISEYNWVEENYQERVFGTTKYRYQSLDGDMSIKDIFQEMIQKEKFLPKYLVPGDYYY